MNQGESIKSLVRSINKHYQITGTWDHWILKSRTTDGHIITITNCGDHSWEYNRADQDRTIGTYSITQALEEILAMAEMTRMIEEPVKEEHPLKELMQAVGPDQPGQTLIATDGAEEQPPKTEFKE